MRALQESVLWGATRMRHAGRMPETKRPVQIVAVLAVLAMALAGCTSSSSGDGPGAKKGRSEKLVEISPLTGTVLTGGRPANPVFIVKIENTFGGEPQYGLNKADMVVEELVEGGLTRLAAFFYSDLPTKVGHVRSMRATDIGIASPVGGQIVASGGAARTYRRVKRAGITIFSEDYGVPGFSSDTSKVRPYNRLVNLQKVARKAKDTRIFGPYLAWKAVGAPKATPTPSGTATPPAAPKHATAATVAFSNSTRTHWALRGAKWHRTNGHAAAGQDFAADTLIVLFCKVGDAGYLDPAGNPVPETVLEGKGRAVLFHGKTVTEATWSKSSLRATISFAGADGAPIAVDPGHVFFELAPKGGGSVSLK